MKLLINILKLIIFILYSLQLIPQFLGIVLINYTIKILQGLKLTQNNLDWVKNLNTNFLYFTSNVLLRNHTNQFIIYLILKLQTIILNLGINTTLILCRSQDIHKGQGLLLKFQAYPQPLEIYNIYFAIWFTLTQESKFLNNDTSQIFICTLFSSLLWNSNNKNEVGDYKPGLCNLISDVKTPITIKCSEWWTLHSNFTWNNETTIIDYINAIIPYHQLLLQARNASQTRIPWINEVHVTSWKISNELNQVLIKRYENNSLVKNISEKKNMFR
jgi:hypothetical protein